MTFLGGPHEPGAAEREAFARMQFVSETMVKNAFYNLRWMSGMQAFSMWTDMVQTFWTTGSILPKSFYPDSEE